MQQLCRSSKKLVQRESSGLVLKHPSCNEHGKSPKIRQIIDVPSPSNSAMIRNAMNRKTGTPSLPSKWWPRGLLISLECSTNENSKRTQVWGCSKRNGSTDPGSVKVCRAAAPALLRLPSSCVRACNTRKSGAC
jgi:hypothetical protein